MEEAILHGCIPVIIQDNIHVPFETSLDTSQFALRFERAKLHTLMDFLNSVPDEEVRMRPLSHPTPREGALVCGRRRSALVPQPPTTIGPVVGPDHWGGLPALQKALQDFLCEHGRRLSKADATILSWHTLIPPLQLLGLRHRRYSALSGWHFAVRRRTRRRHCLMAPTCCRPTCRWRV